MPPNRTEDTRTRKKPGKPITSCAECRRLKLRCDKQIPCGTCVTRGCDAICPDGSLVSRKKKGVFVLSSTRDLHERIDGLVSRISALENALFAHDPSHPLLSVDLLAMKTATATDCSESEKVLCSQNSSPPAAECSTAENVDGAEDSTEKFELEEAFGTLAIEGEGMSGFLGGSSRVEYLLRAGDTLSTGYQFTQPGSRLRPCVIQAASSMFKPSTSYDLISEIVSMIPPPSVATDICELYLANFEFLYQPMSRSELFESVLQKVYNPAINPTDDIHVYGLLFAVLALGHMMDAHQAVPGGLSAHDYHLLSLACVSVSPPYYPKASLDKVELLLMIAMYMHFADYDSMPRHDAWLTIGMALRLAISMGLHLDNERWNLPAAELRRRSRVFWTVYTLDYHIGIGLGRPPSLCPLFIDCPIPKGTVPSEFQVAGEDPMGYHEWIYRFTGVMHIAQRTAFTTTAPTYDALLALDQQIRNFPTPEHLRITSISQVSSERVTNAMPRMFAVLMREGVLMAVHKRYLHVALREMPQDILKHKYAASVMAVYRSSWRLIETILVFWKSQARPFIERVSGIWSYVLAGCLAMCGLVTKAPSSSLTSVALNMLDQTAELFQQASVTCSFAAQHREFIQELRVNAHAAANSFKNGQYNDNYQLQATQLDRLAGKTHLIYTPSSKGLEYSRNDQNSPPQTYLEDNTTGASLADSIATIDNMHAALLQDISLYNSNQATVTAVDDLTPDYPEATTSSISWLANIPTTMFENPTQTWDWSNYAEKDWSST